MTTVYLPSIRVEAVIMLNQKKRILCLFLMVLVLLYGGPSNAAASATPVKPPVIVTFLDVGQADAILIQTKGATMLIDAGNNEDSDLVIKAIKKAGIKKLDYVVGTHPHEDHIGGLDKVIAAFEIGKVIMPKVTTNTATTTKWLQAVAPKYAVISVGADNNYGHSTQATLNKLMAAGAQIFRTDLDGNITATCDGTVITFSKSKVSLVNYKRIAVLIAALFI